MHFRKNRNLICLLLVLYTILLGICSDNVQTDSSLACQDSFRIGTEQESDISVIFSSKKTAASEQAYIPEPFNRCETAVNHLRSVRRTGIRILRSGSFVFSVTDLFSLLFTASSASFYTNFHEIVSNTVIINYIHHQDGEKA